MCSKLNWSSPLDPPAAAEERVARVEFIVRKSATNPEKDIAQVTSSKVKTRMSASVSQSNVRKRFWSRTALDFKVLLLTQPI